MHQSRITFKLIFLITLTVMLTNFLIIFEANRDMFYWGKIANIFYYGFSRTLFGLCICTFIMILFLNHMSVLKLFLMKSYFRLIAKIVIIGALIFPLVSFYLMLNVPSAFYVTFYSVVCLAFGNIVVLIFLGVIFYIFLEYPAQ